MNQIVYEPKNNKNSVIEINSSFNKEILGLKEKIAYVSPFLTKVSKTILSIRILFFAFLLCTQSGDIIYKIFDFIREIISPSTVAFQWI